MGEEERWQEGASVAEPPLQLDEEVRLIIGEEPSTSEGQLQLHWSIASMWKGWLALDLKGD